MNTNPYIQQHLNNLSRAVGHDVTTRYSYIIDQDDLTKAYLQMRNDLGYPLMVDSKYRRAIVYNKEGLEKKIQQMINHVLEENAKKLADLIVNDVTMQLNSITQLANGQIVAKGSSASSGLGGMIGSAIGKGLVKGFFSILDDITEYDDSRRRRR